MIHVRVERLRARGSAVDRQCGPCTACCTVLAVTELRKPARRACDHVDRDGCRVHAERPASCREFHCLWLRGAIAGGEETRPDQLGVCFDYFVTRGSGDAHLIAFELWTGALETPVARSILGELARTHEVSLSYRDGAWSTLST